MFNFSSSSLLSSSLFLTIMIILLLQITTNLFADNVAYAQSLGNRTQLWLDPENNVKIQFTYTPEEPTINTPTTLYFSIQNLQNGNHLKDILAHVAIISASFSSHDSNNTAQRMRALFNNVKVHNGDFFIKYSFPDEGTYQIITRVSSSDISALSSFKLVVVPSQLSSLSLLVLLPSNLFSSANLNGNIIFSIIISSVLTITIKLLKRINLRKQKNSLDILAVILVVATIGLFLQIIGAVWDTFSHLLREFPENFFIPPHSVLYSGVVIELIASGIGAIPVLIKIRNNKNYSSDNNKDDLPFSTTTIKLLVIGSGILLFGGLFDFWWHQTFGFGGYPSFLHIHYEPSHLTLAIGMLVSAIGITIGLTKITRHNLRSPWKQKWIGTVVIAIAFVTLWFSASFTINGSIGIFLDLPGVISNYVNISRIAESLLGILIIPSVSSIIFFIAVKRFSLLQLEEHEQKDVH